MSIAAVVSDGIQVEPAEAPSGSLCLQLLGGFQATVNGDAVTPTSWRLKKAAQLVQLLALTSGHYLHREHVIVHLWPDFSSQSAGNNFRVTLHAARHALEPSRKVPYSFLQYEGQHLFLFPHGTIWVDVIAFEEAANTAFASRDISAYERALALYNGDLMVDDVFDHWIEERRETIRETYLALLLHLAEMRSERAEFSLATAAYKRMLLSDHANEDAHAGLMRVYALSGHRLQAIRQYHRLRDAIRLELDIEPAQETLRLFEAIVSGRLCASQRNMLRNIQ